MPPRKLHVLSLFSQENKTYFGTNPVRNMLVIWSLRLKGMETEEILNNMLFGQSRTVMSYSFPIDSNQSTVQIAWQPPLGFAKARARAPP